MTVFPPLVSVLEKFPTHFFFFNDTATTEIYTLSLHDALPIYLTFGADDRRPDHHRIRQHFRAGTDVSGANDSRCGMDIRRGIDPHRWHLERNRAHELLAQFQVIQNFHHGVEVALLVANVDHPP